MTGMPDLSRLEGQLIDIQQAAAVMKAVVEEIEDLSKDLDDWDIRHSVTVRGEGLDATIDITIDLTSRAPRIRDVLGPVPAPDVAPVQTSAELLDSFRAETMQTAAAQIFDAALTEAMATPGVLVETDDTIPADLSDDWDEADPVREPGVERVSEAATPVDTTAGGNEAHAAAGETLTSPATVAAAEAVTPIAQPAGTGPYADRIAASAPLSEAERTTILAMTAEGLGSGDIAARLNRDPRGFYHFVRRVVEAASQPAPATPTAVKPAPVAAAPAAPKPAPEAPPNVEDAPPLGSTLSSAEHVRLQSLPRWGGWTVSMDLALITGLSRGSRLAEVALDLGMDAASCKRRFGELVPDRTAEQQARVAATLAEIANTKVAA